ncbi:MAG: aquaporin [Candidatus Amulumruptor caecigallinarius]|nr:aquaporin [Candidatus Amulumruptor caecigallinarius]MCM1395977.1 aquaporin [Candidatus Amulumruptor caecigallinarius]MCM1453009.1 aquaporin [bacterium]
MTKKFIAECFGTMFLVLLACGSAVLAGPSIGGLGIGLCFGLVLICLCYAIGGISGCHVNPAVTLGVFLTDKTFGAKSLLIYWIAQFIGAGIGGLLLWFIFNSGAPEYAYGGITGANTLATNVLQPGATVGMALLVEVLLTCFFVYTVLGATSKWGNGIMAGLAIGVGLGLVNIVGIPVDNCSVNPARSFGPALFSPTAWGDFWIMVVGPLCGAILAAVAWKLTSPSRKRSED